MTYSIAHLEWHLLERWRRAGFTACLFKTINMNTGTTSSILKQHFVVKHHMFFPVCPSPLNTLHVLERASKRFWSILFSLKRIEILTEQKQWYLFRYETVESNYQQKSPADRGNDEAEFVQVSDGSSVWGLRWLSTITFCEKKSKKNLKDDSSFIQKR